MANAVLQAIADILAYPNYKKDESVPEPTVSVTEISGSEVSTPVAEILEPLEFTESEPQSTITTQPELDINTTHIQSSPYNDPVNFLDLRDLTLQERLLAISMTHFTSTTPDYATADYLSSFNWPLVFSTLRTLCKQQNITFQRQEFYLVIFRSKLQPTADRMRLGELDKNSHEEACASGGLLHYWFGSPNAENRNLATCIWRNRADAAAGGKGPWHAKARRAAREMYESIEFHTHAFVVEEGAEEWRLEAYQG